MRVLTGKDRDICKLLGTNATELERLLGKSRQTISKHLDRDEFFGVDEIIDVASKKISDERERSHVISQALRKYFPEVVKYTRDLDTRRFSQYYVFGMDIHAEIVANRALERFFTAILSEPSKFVLLACAPVRPFRQLGSWLERFQEEKGEDNTASFMLIPCRLTELTAVQILADPWSNDPQLIGFDQEVVFVDQPSAYRARQIAAALREYGPEARRLASVTGEKERTKAGNRLMHELNTSAFEGIPPEAPRISKNAPEVGHLVDERL